MIKFHRALLRIYSYPDKAVRAQKSAHVLTDHRFFLLHDPALSGQMDFLTCMTYVAHAAGREPFSMHDVVQVFVGLDLCYTDPAQHVITGRLRSR